MKTKKTIFLLSLISLLTACSSLSGNVVPEKGVTMEEVYDNIEMTTTPIEKKKPDISIRPSSYSIKRDFYKLPNPELTIYVFPHLAGAEGLPIPGYETVFSAYEQTHYFLPNQAL